MNDFTQFTSEDIGDVLTLYMFHVNAKHTIVSYSQSQVLRQE